MPRKHCTTRVRTRGAVRLNKDTRMVSLFDLDQAWPDWQVWNRRTISQRQAEQMEEDGEAKRVIDFVDDELRTVGWQLTAPKPADRPSPAMLTESTTNAVANSVGCVKDVRLTPAERRHVEKFAVWALIGDTKAIAVRPRISDQDRRRAEALLGRRAA